MYLLSGRTDQHPNLKDLPQPHSLPSRRAALGEHAPVAEGTLGLADTPLSFGLALLVGSSSFSGLVFSFWVGAVIGIFILARRPRGSRMGIEVPFAPFLATGFLLAYITQWNPFIFAAALPW